MESAGDARRLILLPGLGADERLFTYQRERFPQLEVPPWLPPERNESLPAYAGRMAAKLNIEEPVYLGGASFGGMLALEMAKRIPVKSIFLISSAYSGREVNRLLRLVHPVGRRMPVSFVATAFRSATVFSPEMRSMEREKKSLLRAMFDETPPEFVRWASCALMDWIFQDKPEVPVQRIHGERDIVIPLRRQPAEAIVPGGGHFICLTHGEMVNEFILKHLE